MTPKNGFPGLIVVHFYVKFGDLSCISFRDIVQKTETQTRGSKNPTPVTAIGAGNEVNCT